MSETKELNGKITYDKLFWLFLFGSVIGVIVEGTFCLLFKGHWESHVLTLVGQFNALYGIGAVLFYIIITLLRDKSIIVKSGVIMIAATLLELLCGIFLADMLGMKAWDYSNNIMNFRGIICLTFAVGWGVSGFVFCLLYERVDRFLCKLVSKKWHVACIALSLFMAVNLSVTAVAIERWSSRHYGFQANTYTQRVIDEYTPDDWMQMRFPDWSFLDNTNSGK